MAKSWKEWEKPLLEIDEALAKAKEIAKNCAAEERAAAEERIAYYEQRRDNIIKVMYSRLGAWEKVLVARAEPRPYALDYIGGICTDFVELGGDRRIGDDHAVVGGPAMFNGRPVMILGQQKGRNIQDRQYRNFAMAKPEGYRKAIRLMEMANRCKMPVLSFVDTPAADPGVESESRGISEAIAASILAMFDLEVPSIAVIIGEGGSGGAIGLAAASKVLMQEHAVYSVIPPEGCAAILWRQPAEGAKAAAALRLTAQNALEWGLIDGIINEPFGAAHRDWNEAMSNVKTAVQDAFLSLEGLSGDQIKAQRYEKFRKMGQFVDGLVGTN
ncbi:MAG: acetyl-CoA carboxylase carboxyltransferase subunit alpha [Armatimonadetes bacterium]|nr:acetyl-CoA carboxylase carboxyltransferase subunit alpha [Armatimonadota bacterium]